MNDHQVMCYTSHPPQTLRQPRHELIPWFMSYSFFKFCVIILFNKIKTHPLYNFCELF